MMRSAVISVAVFLGGCNQVYPSEPFFSEFRHQQYDLERGVLYFEESASWKANEARFGFQVDGWTVGAIGLNCEEHKTNEGPLKYRIDASARIIEFGESDRTRCYLGERNSANFMLYPIISSRSLFDPGEIEGAVHFSVAFKPVIR